MDKCKALDPLACKQLYDENAGWLYAVCMRYAGDRDLANDLLQDSFILIFERLDSYSGTGNFKGWMRKVVVNVALTHFRKHGRRRDNVRMDEQHEDAMVDMGLMNELDHTELTKFICGLSEGRRQVFNAYVIEGYAHKEIAEMLGISEGTSKSQLYDAKQELKKAIEGQYAVAKKQE